MEENTRVRKPAKTRTSITIDPELLNDVRSYCDVQSKMLDKDVSVSSIIEEALRKFLAA
jgi:hypothetical protein